jgi:putative spermidine/putrescine transport system ATP-binding protein
VFLLDEPLSNLDAKLRVEVREEIKALQQELGLTTIFVTHDQEEALTIADRLAVMHDGRVQQVGCAAELYERPANRFVADFLGTMNFISGRADSAHGFVSDKGTPIRVTAGRSGACVHGLRPERMTVTAHPVPGHLSLSAHVTETVYKGSLLEVRTRTGGGDVLVSHMPNTAATSDARVTPGAACFVSFAEGDCQFLD